MDTFLLDLELGSRLEDFCCILIESTMRKANVPFLGGWNPLCNHIDVMSSELSYLCWCFQVYIVLPIWNSSAPPAVWITTFFWFSNLILCFFIMIFHCRVTLTITFSIFTIIKKKLNSKLICWRINWIFESWHHMYGCLRKSCFSCYVSPYCCVCLSSFIDLFPPPLWKKMNFNRALVKW